MFMTTEKLVAYLRNHDVKVLNWTESRILVETHFTKDGVADSMVESIRANYKAVRNYLGY